MVPERETVKMKTVEELNAAVDFIRTKIGVNVIPADTIHKEAKELDSWTKWQTKPIPQELHDKWKKEGKFKKGIAIICGKCWHTDSSLWFNGIDFDNQKAIDMFCKNITWAELKRQTYVEIHMGTKGKAHVAIYTKDRPLTAKSMKSDDPSKPSIEVKSGGNLLLFCAPSPHEDGSNYESVGLKIPAVWPWDKTTAKLAGIFNGKAEHGATAVKDVSAYDMDDDDFRVHMGKRHEFARTFMNFSLLREDGKAIIDKKEYETNAWDFANRKCIPAMDHDEAEELIRDCWNHSQRKLASRSGKKIKWTKEEWSTVHMSQILEDKFHPKSTSRTG